MCEGLCVSALTLVWLVCFQLAQQLRLAKAQQQDAVPTTEEEKKKRYKQKKVCLNFTTLGLDVCGMRECVGGKNRGACGIGGGRGGVSVGGRGGGGGRIGDRGDKCMYVLSMHTHVSVIKAVGSFMHTLPCRSREAHRTRRRRIPVIQRLLCRVPSHPPLLLPLRLAAVKVRTCDGPCELTGAPRSLVR